jgi:glutamate carboxypeptidase
MTDPGIKDALSWIDDQHQDLVDRLVAWSAINSGSHNGDGLRKMGTEVAEAFSVLGAEYRKQETAPGQRVASDGSLEPVPHGPVHIFSKRPTANRRVLLTGHLDTVFAAEHPFQSPRFLDENTLNGPGAADMKGGLLVMLTALEALEKSGLGGAIGYDVLINSDEEIGSMGSAPMLVELAATADFGLTYEPALADGTLAGARKGSGNFTLLVRGRAAHAGRDFDKGRNAVTKLAAMIGELDDLNRKLDDVTINAAIIEGGGAINVVPDLAICRFNVRVMNDQDAATFGGKLDELLARHGEDEGISCELHGGFNRPPKPLSTANQRLFEILATVGAELDLEISWQPTGGCCDGNNLAAAGLANIDSLGVRGGHIHSEREYALVDSLTERAKLSALMLMKYAAGEFSLKDEEAS